VLEDIRIVLVGCGNMGGAMLRGWLESGLRADSVVIADPLAAAGAVNLPADVAVVADAGELADQPAPDVVVVAVKPQVLAAVLPAVARLTGENTVLLSVAAGKPVAYYAAAAGESAAIVRVMPNTPAAIGRGMSVLFAGEHVSGRQKEICELLMSAVGETAWLDDEALMHQVTAVSGSGPAYVFLLIEALMDAGIQAGLSEELSLKLALQTTVGAADLAAISGLSPARLRRNVTSPNGTTQAALEVLMDAGGLPGLMQAAVAAATARSKELAQD
jgi:pyrroline-5-carboxylate reductase